MTTMRPPTRDPQLDRPRPDGRVMGKISALLPEKGFGFITHGGTGEDYFFHKSECLDIWDQLAKYQLVVFAPGEGPKGKRATQVELA